jgi:hypothetical protein
MANEHELQRDEAAQRLRQLLREHPGLLREHPELVDELDLPPDGADSKEGGLGGRARKVVSLEQRRNRQLQERVDRLQGELERLVAVARENDHLAVRLHSLTLELFRSQGREERIQTLLGGLRDAFSVEAAALRLEAERFGDTLGHGHVAPRQWLRSLFPGGCSALLGPPSEAEEEAGLFASPTADPVRSRALLALLRDNGDLVGVLAVGSVEADRYQPGMGATYLERLAEVAAELLATEPASCG